METKIVRFPNGYFVRKKEHPLTSKMINTLLDACEKQQAGIPFGPADIKGSFTALITRGLIVRKHLRVDENTEPVWQVTAEAVEMLRTMGIKVPLKILKQFYKMLSNASLPIIKINE